VIWNHPVKTYKIAPIPNSTKSPTKLGYDVERKMDYELDFTQSSKDRTADTWQRLKSTCVRHVSSKDLLRNNHEATKV
jgi:hypothetical protein